MLAEINAAGERWPRLVRSWPELYKIRPGRWQGAAWIRPAVFLAEPAAGFPDVPLVLLRHEDGEWFRKGDRQGRP